MDGLTCPKVGIGLVKARRAAAGALRRARLARGLSQEQAAKLCGVGVRTLRDCELGRARMTALEVLLVLTGEAEKAA